MVSIKVRLVFHGEYRTFEHTIADTSQASIEAAVDYFEGQIGTVVTIYDVANPGVPLYRAMADMKDVI